jgi:hypothetical protein
MAGMPKSGKMSIVITDIEGYSGVAPGVQGAACFSSYLQHELCQAQNGTFQVNH